MSVQSQPGANVAVLPDFKVISMDVDCADEWESYYRILINGHVKYLLVELGTFAYDVLSFPPLLMKSLPPLPPGPWKHARIFRRLEDVVYETSTQSLPGVTTSWHPNCIDVISLPLVKRYSPNVYIVDYNGSKAVAKIARFYWEIDNIERETMVYKALQGRGIAPRFLGHLVEDGRIMGLLLEQVDGRFAGIEDLAQCRDVLRQLHRSLIKHGDTNRYNFIIEDDGAKLIDFELGVLDADQASLDEELAGLPAQLLEETGRGGVETLTSDSDGDS